jgi:hypothetical protein
MEAPPAVFGGLADEVIEQISAKARARQIAVADQISATILRTSGQSSEPLASSSQASASPSIRHGLRPDRVPVEGHQPNTKRLRLSGC